MKLPKYQIDESPPPSWQARKDRYAAVKREGIHVTDLVNCPRKKALRLDGAVADGNDEATAWGSALHELVGTSEIPVVLELNGVSIVGSADDLIDGIVIDYKFPNTDSFYWIVKNKAPKSEHVWQVEAYRAGLAQRGVVTRGGRIQYGAHSAGKWPNWLGFEWHGDVQTTDDLLAFQPFDSPYSVRDILALQGSSVDNIPLVGETIKFGKDKTMCDYCDLAIDCKLRASAAPAAAAF